MASGRGKISIGSFGGSSPISNEKMIHDLLGWFSSKFCNSSHHNTFFRVISELEISWGRDKEISDHFIVDLDVGDGDIVFVVWIFIDVVENISNG